MMKLSRTKLLLHENLITSKTLMKKIFNLTVLIMVLSRALLISQNIKNTSDAERSWVEMMQDPAVNFYDVQKVFQTYWKDKKVSAEESENEEEGGWQQFKRWENYMEPRVYPSGKRVDPSLAYQEYQNYLSSNIASYKNSPAAVQANSWTFLGPSSNATEGMVGRLNLYGFSRVITILFIQELLPEVCGKLRMAEQTGRPIQITSHPLV